MNKHFDESTKKLLEELQCADFYLFGLKKKKKKLKKSLNLPENQKNKKRLKKIHHDLNVLSYRIERRSEEKKNIESKLIKKNVTSTEFEFFKKNNDTNCTKYRLRNLNREIDSLAGELIKCKTKDKKSEAIIRQLSDELKKSKKLPQKPNLKPNNSPKGSKLNPNDTSQKGKVQNGNPPNNKRNKRGGSKKGKTKKSKNEIRIDEKIVCEPNGPVPERFKLIGYKKRVVQNLIIKTHNIEYSIPRFYDRHAKKTFPIDLPAGVKGHFGGTLRTFVLFLHHTGRVTEKNLKIFLTEMGCQISSGQIHKILTEKNDLFHEEKDDILKTGLRVSDVVQTDHMGVRHSGKNGYCNVICNELFTVFNTVHSKSRLSFLKILGCNKAWFTFNEAAFSYLKKMKLPKKWIDLFDYGDKFDENDLYDLLKKNKININSKVHRSILEAGLMGYLFESGFNMEIILHSDGAKEFMLFIHCLCWIHAARPIKEINASTEYEAKLIENALTKFWEFYKKLKAYKINPTQKEAKRLESEFVAIFSEKTGYDSLDKAINGILLKKDQLLLVLKRPEAPIHNNGSETEGRESVVRTRISKTNSEIGTKSRDTFLSLMKTTRKLKISFWDYLYDRIHHSNKIENLAKIIEKRVWKQPIYASA